MSNKLKFNIKEVADIIGVVPATIRNWEKQKLFISKRSKNNYRYYTLDDIEFLKKIKHYSVDKRINSETIRVIMGNEGSADARVIYEKNMEKSDRLLSHKWKEKRESLGYTLENVSNETGISISYLSKIENGQANLSIDVLNRLADFYRESILYFVEKANNSSKVVRKNKGDLIDIGIEGVNIESLAGVSDNFIFPVIYFLDPGCGSIERHRHNGEEFIYVLSGKLEVKLNDNEVYVLKKEDSIIFKSSEYHEWKNIDKNTAKVLWVHSPITK